jgi:hypothetical protein
MPSPGRVEDWRACWRWRVSSPALSMAGWVHHATVATCPTPATSHRTGGAPADGVPTTVVQERSRSRAASSSRGEVVESTCAVQGRKWCGRSAPRHACPPPWPQTWSHLAVQVLELLGRVADAAIVAPPAHEPVACGHPRRDGTPHAASCGLRPTVAPDGVHGLWSGPPAWDARPGRPGAAWRAVAPEPRTPGALHVDETRLGGRPRPGACRPDRRDRRPGWRGLASRAADQHQVVRRPRAVTPRARRLCPGPRPHRSGAVGQPRAHDAPVG